jgi:HAD superfamily hydrolase (TIGR01509 family)
MGLQALVFDFDGLIVDTEMPEYVTVKAEFEAHGVRLELDDWLAIIGRADHLHWLDWLEQARGEPIEREVVRARRQMAHAELIAATEILPGVMCLLDQADQRGIPVAVASSSSRDWVDGQLQRLGIRSRFTLVCTRDDVPRAKPWPDVYLAAVAGLGTQPGSAVAFEDSFNGSLAATAAGLYCVVAPNPLTSQQDFSHADLVVSSLAEVRLDDLTDRLGAVGLDTVGREAEPG